MEESINSDFVNLEMRASQTFDNILDSIRRSNLNFQFQVSPFSAYISLKRSLMKDKSGSFLTPRSPSPSLSGTVLSPQTSSTSDLAQLVTKINKLENALIIQQNNHEAAMNDHDEELQNLKASNEKLMDDNRKLQIESKTLKQETKSFVTKLENRALEAKQLKGKIDELNKDKNVLNVALKSVKQDVKSQARSYEKQIIEYEKKVSELNEFKTKKQDEEKREKLIKKKELKKEAKKNRNNNNTSIQAIHENVIEAINISEENSVVQEEEGPKPMVPRHELPPHCIMSEVSHTSHPDSECLKTSSDLECKNIELEEKEEGFIGPRLPRMLTDDEVKAIFDRLLGDKYG